MHRTQRGETANWRQVYRSTCNLPKKKGSRLGGGGVHLSLLPLLQLATNGP